MGEPSLSVIFLTYMRTTNYFVFNRFYPELTNLRIHFFVPRKDSSDAATAQASHLSNYQGHGWAWIAPAAAASLLLVFKLARSKLA